MITIKLKTTGNMEKVMARLGKGGKTFVGIQKGAGTHEESGMSYAKIGEALQYGFNGPPRPWATHGIRRGKADIVEVVKAAIPLLLAGKLKMIEVTEMMGEECVNSIQRSIAAREYAKNAMSTLAQKKGDLALQDTGGFRERISQKSELM